MPQEWGWSVAVQRGYGPVHIAKDGDRSPSVCGRVNRVKIYKDGVIEGTLCKDCCRWAAGVAEKFSMNDHHRKEAWSCSQLLRRLYPWWKQRDHELADMVAMFLSSQYRAPRVSRDIRESFIKQVTEYLVDRLSKEGIPQYDGPLTQVERRWHIRQRAQKNNPPSFISRRDRLRLREVEQLSMQAEREALELVDLGRCKLCEQNIEDCTCSPEEKLWRRTSSREKR